MREHSQLSELAEIYHESERIDNQIVDAEQLMRQEKDPEMREMVKGRVGGSFSSKKEAEDRLKFLLIPKDPLDEKNIIMEIRGGAGGEEAALFAADLFRMYSRFAGKQGLEN